MMNDNILTVTQVNTYIKSVLSADSHLNNIFIVGEISNFLHYFRSGHMYFTLKDNSSQIKAVMFNSYAQRLKFTPTDGMKVICRGRVSLYEKDGVYQIYVEDMQPDGLGALSAAYEQLKEKLSKEGLFDSEHKKQIPAFPKVIGVATSDMGAAVEDIKNITKRRYPAADLYLVPTAVQGVQASGDIVKSLKLLDSIDEVDVIIVGRGGGSIEDLWAFNTEEVARAVFDCEKPVISAVGHETDFTICDFVADLRAPTPSAAAELAVPDINSVIALFDSYLYKLSTIIKNRIEYERLRLDDITEKSGVLNYQDFFVDKFDTISDLVLCMTDAYKYSLERKHNVFSRLVAQLDALSPLKILTRGYGFLSKDNKAIKSIVDININDNISITLSDGNAKCTVREVYKNE